MPKFNNILYYFYKNMKYIKKRKCTQIIQDSVFNYRY